MRDDEQPKPSDDTARPADADPTPSPDPGRGAPSSLVGEEDARRDRFEPL